MAENRNRQVRKRTSSSGPRRASQGNTRTKANDADDRSAAILAVIRRIPRGRVASYGQIADLAGLPGRSRLVGQLLARTEEHVPWQRVVNAAGGLSWRASGSEELQQLLLAAEGVEFRASGRVDLKRFGWRLRGLV